MPSPTLCSILSTVTGTLESIGILAGLIFSSLALKESWRHRKTDSILGLYQAGHTLRELITSDKAIRVLDPNANPINSPPTPSEILAVSAYFQHTFCSWCLARDYPEIWNDGIVRDIEHFLSHPLPSAVYPTLRPFLDSTFMRFIDEINILLEEESLSHSDPTP